MVFLVRLKKSAIGVLDVYNQIENLRKRFGKVKKAEIHFHTPASYDYRLKTPDKYYYDLTEEEIIEYAYELGYFSENEKCIYLNDFKSGKFSDEEYLKILTEKKLPFESFKEYLSYQLIAYKMYTESIEVAVITDHNTISGFYKLKYSLNQYYQEKIKPSKKNISDIKLILGVEISCSDCNHVVGIFDEGSYDNVQRFLNEIIHDEKSGTIENTYTILNLIKENQGIGYIAHINTYEGVGTKLYKEKLFNPDFCKILGITNLNVDGWKSKTSKSFDSSKICFIHESDSHLLSEIGVKNTWIKMNRISFKALKIALQNHTFCIFTEKPESTPIFIKGIAIKPVQNSFLRKNQSNDLFILDFSKDLNCIIGGRGTGKSTILNIMDTIFTQEAESINKLKFISLYETIYVVFRAYNKDYVIRFLPQVYDHYDITRNDFFSYTAFKNSSLDDEKKLSKEWYDLYEIPDRKSAIEISDINDCEMILTTVYKKHYSINHIINLIQQRKLGNFIKEVIHAGISNDQLSKILLTLRNSKEKDFLKNLKTSISKLYPVIEKIEKNAFEKTQGFNNHYSNIIQIKFSPLKNQTSNYIFELFRNSNIKLDRYISKTKLKWIDLITYLDVILNKITYLEFLDMLVNRQFARINKIEPIKKYATEPLTSKDIANGFENIDNVTTGRLLGPLYDIVKNNKEYTVQSIENYIKSIDDFTLLFNINSKQSLATLSSNFREIETLSLGQQVVALLTFIMEYGKYIGDYTPFIIDQPEDNLDNQYIYNTLVASLRKIKNHRQVIVVTHNSTIVTNADAEQVIILNSDGKSGYIEKTGYISDEKIMKLIMVHLEGGGQAFKDKMFTYSTILN